MKKIILAIAALACSMSVNAQIVKIMKGETVVKEYKAADYDKVVFEEATAKSNLLPGEFSVSATKTVQFTKGNLYWDGSAFKFESNQYDYQTSWDANHVSHFYWTKTADNSYAESYSDGTNTTGDVPFFAESKGGLTVEDTEGLYALSKAEWTYLYQTRTNAGSLYKKGVTVAGKTNCLIIAPDGYTGTLASSYTAEEWATAEMLGLVCLPAASYRGGSKLDGYYWSATPHLNTADNAYGFKFYSDGVYPASSSNRNGGYSLRLVK